MTVTVRPLVDGEWRVLRDVRLASLRDAPYAFNTTFEALCADDDAVWAERLGAQAWFVAEDRGAVVGVAAGGPLRDPEPQVRTARAVWVAEPWRGTGVAAALLDAVRRWALEDGATTLRLWSLDGAPRAHAFYARYGFTVVAEAPRPDHPPMTRFELRL